MSPPTFEDEEVLKEFQDSYAKPYLDARPAVKPIVVYVAGPYRDERGMHYVRRNIERARRVAIELWQMGVVALCPHLNTAFMDGAVPDDYFLDGDLHLLKRCDALVTVPDEDGLKPWQHSSGTRREVMVAEQAGIPGFGWCEVGRERFRRHFSLAESEVRL